VVPPSATKKSSSAGKRKGNGESGENNPKKKAKKGVPSRKKAAQCEGNRQGGSKSAEGAGVHTDIATSAADESNLAQRKSRRVRQATSRSKGS
jgi:hypothetical protein